MGIFDKSPLEQLLTLKPLCVKNRDMLQNKETGEKFIVTIQKDKDGQTEVIMQNLITGRKDIFNHMMDVVSLLK